MKKQILIDLLNLAGYTTLVIALVLALAKREWGIVVCLTFSMLVMIGMENQLSKK